MMVIVPRIKMRSALLHDDVDTGAGGYGSLHFFIRLYHSTTSQPLSALNCATLQNIFLQPSPKLELLSTPP